MIFVTIGTQEPFDRFISIIDEIAYNLNLDVLAQVSNKSKYNCRHIKSLNFIIPNEFDDYLDSAELVISHAGMGTIISALIKKKPLIVFPREYILGEHRSDHQIATARYFNNLKYLNVANNATQLEALVQDFLKGNLLRSSVEISEYASETLINSIDTDLFEFMIKLNLKGKL